MIRAIILAATIAALFTLWRERPLSPVIVSQVDYCVITYKGAGKDEMGQWHQGWVQGYGPCSLLDRYENI
jgi:hypothetical protein